MEDNTRIVAVLFSDLEGSTSKWARYGSTMGEDLAVHDRLSQQIASTHGALLLKHTGDGMMAVFANVASAVSTALDLVRAMNSQAWSIPEGLRVRIGIDLGPATERDGDWFGTTINRAARVADAANAGQVLLSEDAELAARAMITDHRATDVGVVSLAGLPQPQRLYHLDAVGPPAPPRRAVRSSLPAPPTSLVGRAGDLAELAEILDTFRLVTLTGVGGVGKTRLAVAAAGRYPGEVVFVDLSLVGDEGVWQALARGVGVLREGESLPRTSVLAALHRRQVLIVLDNCEHLLDEVAAVTEDLLASTSARVLATSREALAVAGERVVRVRSLAIDDSVALFLDRAMAGGREYRSDTPGVREIAERLDGIPLALELAAARTAHLAPVEIAQRLDERFRLLVGGRRGAERQRTLDAVMAWSYDTLDRSEQRGLWAASVFFGGFDLEAFAAVSRLDELAAVDLIGSLVNKSLVVAGEREGRTTRYSLLETVRLYGRQKAAEGNGLEGLVAAHAAYFLERSRAGDLIAHPFIVYFDPVDDTDQENHHAALEWYSAIGDTTSTAVMAASTVLVHGYLEIDREVRHLEQARAADALVGVDRHLYLVASAFNANARGAWPAQLEWSSRTLEEATDPVLRGMAAGLAAQVHGFDDEGRARQVAEAALAELGDDHPQLAAFLKGRMADAPLIRGRVEEVMPVLEELASLGDGLAIIDMAKAMHVLGRDQEVIDLVERHMPRIGGFYQRSQLTALEAMARAAMGDRGGAIEALHVADHELRRAFDPLVVHELLVAAASIAYHSGDYLHASWLLALVGARSRTPGGFAIYASYRDRVRDKLDSATVERIRAEGAGVDADAVLAEEITRLSAERNRAATG